MPVACQRLIGQGSFVWVDETAWVVGLGFDLRSWTTNGTNFYEGGGRW